MNNPYTKRIEELTPLEKQLWADIERAKDPLIKKWMPVHDELEKLKRKSEVWDEVGAAMGNPFPEITPTGPATPMPELPVIKPITTQLAEVPQHETP